MPKFRAIFMGTPDFAVPCLAKLCEICNVVTVITQPDKKRGRGQKLTPSPVKTFALEHNIPVLQPVKIKEFSFVKKLADLKPDIIIVVAFGQILSQAILDIPPKGCINVHASLLPRYRGAAPIHWAIIRGEKETGVTTMYMDAGLDTGDIILNDSIQITDDMTTEVLHDKLMIMGAALLDRTIKQIETGTVQRKAQDDALSTYSPLLNDTTCRIEWKKSALSIHNQVRGLNSWPVAYSILEGKKIKIWQTALSEENFLHPGEIVRITKHGFLVAAETGSIEILELQAPNKKRMSARDYINGHKLTLPLTFE
ncbi:methionyl-tRNA formyltransferase [Pectinatus sottacetonis]|uniref:methionyl-tRNA formyltransferase n=1 Tax=Pectinatus sottacetonis TaxID=1002795 RepID=UPI0018C6EF04|nr:methionyl-tRNA formyltransferase [Pectinatus sottacetonis]